MQRNRFGAGVERSAGVGVRYDAGLRDHMRKVYNRMSAGVFVTALTAWLVASSPVLQHLFLGGPQAYVIMFAPLAVVWFGFRPDRMSPKALMFSFFGLCVLYGISFSVISLAYTGESIARVFFMTVALFAGLSIFGYTSKRNLDALGTFAMMGVMGVLIFSIGTIIAAAFGVETSMMQNVISVVGLLAFSGVTAWQTQVTKQMYSASYGDDANDRMAWAAALNLYISFIAIFQYLIRFMGDRG